MSGAAAGFASVVLVQPSLSHLARAFTYAVPDGMEIARGSLVRVPFRGRNRPAVVIELLDEPDVERALPIAATLGPGLPADVLDLAAWTAQRYLATLGEALVTALPDRVVGEETASPGPIVAVPRAVAAPDEQLHGALSRGGAVVWRPSAQQRRGETIAALAAATLARGRGVLVLVPEVSVASDVAATLHEAFGDALAWLGSDRTQRERYRAWLSVRDGARLLAAGGRGAVFAPVRDLGLVIVDDEGHQAFKEGRAPRFHARTVAAERARGAGAALLLVGVPPSMEARAAVASGAATMIAPSRDDERRSRPPVTVVERGGGDDEGHVPSARTLTIARSALAEGKRIVVLTHRSGDEAAAITDRAARAVRARRAVSLDARAGAAALRRAERHADLIVATPYVAKDLAVEGAGLLAIVDADAALSQPGFRAQEDAFATWWQAARWATGGAVVVETRDPKQPAVAALVRWDPDVLWRAEASRREELGYPPFGALARIDVPAERGGEVAEQLAATGRLDVLGPVEHDGATVVAVRARRREELLDALRPIVARWREADEPMRVDVDPREVLEPRWRSSRSERSATRS